VLVLTFSHFLPFLPQKKKEKGREGREKEREVVSVAKYGAEKVRGEKVGKTCEHVDKKSLDMRILK